MKTKWIAAAVLAASSAGLTGSVWNSAQAESLNGDAPNTNRPTNDQACPCERGMRGQNGGMNGGQNGRRGMPRDAESEANRIAGDVTRDFDKTLTDAQKVQLKTAIEARDEAMKVARNTFQSKLAQITGITEEQLRAKRREMRHGPGGQNGGLNGHDNENGRPQGPPPAMDNESPMNDEPFDRLMDEAAPR